MPDGLAIALGLVTLLGGAELLVRGAVWFALALGVRPMIVGVTIVAFGTSMPELVVGLVDVLQGSQGLAAGTVFGSNIANIALIIGISATICRIQHVWGEAAFECAFLIFVSLLTLVPLFVDGGVTRGYGIVLLAVLLGFVAYLVRHATRAKAQAKLDNPDREPHPPLAAGAAALHGLAIAAGIGGLVLGAEWLVNGAKGVALDLGMSESLAGQTIVAIGTSLPELATSVVAALRNHSAIALGNVIGSNIFNVCMVLGATAIVRPVPLAWVPEGPSIVTSLVLAVVLVALLRGREGVSRGAGIAFLLAYVAYMAFSITR